MKQKYLKLVSLMLPLALFGCSKENVRETFFKNRPCPEIKFKCLNQENQIQLPSTPYVLTEKDYARIERHKNLRMYKDITRMLDIYYPGFWEGVDEEKQIEWVKQTHEIAKRYYDPPLSRGEIEMMAHLCSIIGVDFETNPQFQFVVKKLKNHEIDASFATGDVINYFRFEILHKDYSISGIHYNTWSLKRARKNMPPMMRAVPDFYEQTRIQDEKEDLYQIYEEYLEGKNMVCKVLRIGVFFDGIGNNLTNDQAVKNTQSFTKNEKTQ